MYNIHLFTPPQIWSSRADVERETLYRKGGMLIQVFATYAQSTY